MHLKFRLPSGEDITVPNVEENATPGHLKENLKYSLRAPPKFIRLALEDGRVLDDIKPLAGEPNNVRDGDLLVATVDETMPEIAEEAPRPAKQTIIRKEEPPKPKKPKKETQRPTVGAEDVVKKDVLKNGSHGWSAKYLEGKSSTRQMAFIRVEAVDTKQHFPEDQDETMAIALGDPLASPAWTAAVVQMDIGEKALFSMTYKVVDYNPDYLCPDADTTTWIVELVKVAEVLDINEDFQQLLHVVSPGDKEKPDELDQVAVHWRVWRWTSEGRPCIGSSRERIALLPGYGLVPVEDPHAPPVTISVGEGQQEAFELVSMRLGKGGQGHLYLKPEALKENRPKGLAIVDIELVAVKSCKGPGSSGWNGWQSIVMETEYGDAWVDKADENRQRLETYDAMRKTTESEREAKDQITEQANKYARNGGRRYRRALTWLSKIDPSTDPKVETEMLSVKMRLARSICWSHAKFGEDAEKPVSEEAKKALTEATQLLESVLEQSNKASLTYEALKAKLQIHLLSHEVKEGREVLEKLHELSKENGKDDTELRDFAARFNRLDAAVQLQQGAGSLETAQLELRAAVEAKDAEAAKSGLAKLHDLIVGQQVKYADVLKLKVGKDVGNAIKMGDPEVTQAGRKIVGGIQALAQKADIGL
jgi:hypothetical protein